MSVARRQPRVLCLNDDACALKLLSRANAFEFEVHPASAEVL
jgi:hypothetical protein